MSNYAALSDWYDSLTGDVDYEGLLQYIHAILKQRGLKPESVLDMACGTGSLSYLFAAEGLTTYGVDLSEDMLVRAAAKAGDAEHIPVFLRGNMAEFVLQEPVDLIVCMLDSFNYLSDPEQGKAAIRCFYESLKPGGLLIFDVRPIWQLRNFDGQIFMDETDDVVCIWRTEFDEELNQCFYGMDIFVREAEAEADGGLWSRSQEEHVEYAYSLDFLQQALEDQGFENITMYGDRTFLPPTQDEDRVFILAGKKE